MEQSKVIRSEQGQAVLLPESLALPDDVRRVDIVAVGRSRVISPVSENWDKWFEDDNVSDDFMKERGQPV
ncbi:type II toxin-antitoxin system VapB family antitoxin [Pseudomonas viridiflava]|uniref:AbrB/MazE/SpoVT family DNA-binding domain-containing protein n=1 Tax=Pseudomonas viridiflava TaxID=33069 RepID=A0AA46VZQ4_PSEVI|nr:type II toxin-antitoxin system VapB family antitoxin [Pseudomonas viridiflava]MBV1808167.1 AbrB/MazE/SpoVT family DNA-binding domain-containing protein [Pseudomonas viridiflava]MBV1814429.1 AbrB/MazE/SpoVT family DNA-binding domain-containing protein [Pseudomonas viridiflava]MCI3908223.1 type II toxin-antitoxin system VapB family antitoxin [Pseudomonas viridiflava]MCQ9391558.1 type II toxin-antitoxin system VapB family antitoxin [Pseudomonas viridiflava]MEE4075756.1 type II toxin-antitoxin 